MSSYSFSPRGQIGTKLFSASTPRGAQQSIQNVTKDHQIDSQQEYDNFKPFQKQPILFKQEIIIGSNEQLDYESLNNQIVEKQSVRQFEFYKRKRQSRNILQFLKINNLVKRFKNELLTKSYIFSSQQKQTILKNSIFQENYLNKKEQNSLTSISFVIQPSNKFLIFWDVLKMFLLWMLLILLPYYWSFENEKEFFETFEVIIIQLFLISDVFLKLNVAAINKGNIIKSRKYIAKKYLSTFFIVDLLFIISLYLTYVFRDLGVFSIFCIGGFIKLQRVIGKIVKLLNLSELQREMISLVNLLFTVNLIAHFIACIWHYIGIISLESEEQSWITYKNLEEKSNQIQYIYSYYWAIVTMITVGYGDITPQNHIEALSCIFLMLLSCAVFTFSLNSVGTIVSNISKKKREFQEMLRILTSYMQQHSVPDQLQSRAKSYLEYRCLQRNQQSKYHLQNILQQLSSFLQSEIMHNVFKNLLQNSFIINLNFSEDTIKKMANQLQTAYFCPDEYIYHQNQNDDDNYLYFIDYGKVEILEQNSKFKVAELEKGMHFGEESFFTNKPRRFNAISKNFTKVFRISSSTFLNIISEEEKEVFQQLKEQIQLDLPMLGRHCQICEQKDHYFTNCKYIKFKPDIEKIILKSNLLKQCRNKFERKKRKTVNTIFIAKQLRLVQKMIETTIGENHQDDEDNQSITQQENDVTINYESPNSKRKESLTKQSDLSQKADIKVSHDSAKKISIQTQKSENHTKIKHSFSHIFNKQQSDTEIKLITIMNENKTQFPQTSAFFLISINGFEKVKEFKKFFPHNNVQRVILDYNRKGRFLNKFTKNIYSLFDHQVKKRNSVRKTKTTKIIQIPNH